MYDQFKAFSESQHHDNCSLVLWTQVSRLLRRIGTGEDKILASVIIMNSM